jgi:hypothetical protein
LNKYFIFKIDAANDILYGFHQSRVDRNYPMNVNNNNKSSEQDKLLNTSPIRTDLKLTVNDQITFARDLFRSSTCLTRADKSRILAFIAGVRGM